MQAPARLRFKSVYTRHPDDPAPAPLAHAAYPSILTAVPAVAAAPVVAAADSDDEWELLPSDSDADDVDLRGARPAVNRPAVLASASVKVCRGRRSRLRFLLMLSF